MLKQFLDFVKYYGKDKKLHIVLFLLISFFAGILEFVGIGLIYPFLIMIINPKILINTNFYHILVNFIGEKDIFSFTIIIGVLIALMFIGKNLLMIFCVFAQNKFVINWKNDINKMLMNFYLNVPYQKIFENTNSEKIYNMTVLTSQTLETFVLRALVCFSNSIIILLILSLMLFKFPTIALFSIIFVTLCMFGLNKFFKQKTEILAPEMLNFSLKNNNQVIENVKNLKEIRIFSAQKYFLKKFMNVQKKNNDVIFKNAFYAGIPPYCVEMILVFALIFLACAISLQNNGDSSRIIASYGLIMAVVFRIAPSLNRIQIALNHINSSKEMVIKMNEEYLKNNFDNVFNIPKSQENIIFNNKLSFKNVYFEYKKGQKVLNDISFEIKKGEFVGIIGLSGAGKSTIADILMGLLTVDCGEILIDGHELNDKNINSFRNIIGYVPQEMNVLEDSFKNNVAWGVEDFEIDEKRVLDALKEAQLLDFVISNGGISSIVKGLSYGQKQRLQIARALYRNPEIILFDEATSALDVETENEITKMLTSLKGEKTIIAIAHRLVTLKECDKLIYLKDGSIVDVGSFEDLKNKYKDFENLINLSKF